MHKYLALLLLSVLFSSATAQITLRQLPVAGERGRLGETLQLPLVKIGSKTYRLAPGGMIFDQNNRTIVHASLPKGAEVFFTKDMNGDLQRVFLVTKEESAMLDRRKK